MIARALLVVGAALAACSTSGATTDRGLGGKLRVRNAQYVQGAMPAGSADGPKVASLMLPTNNIHPGYDDDPLTCALDPSATSVALQVDGDPGYWIVPAGVPAVATPNDPSIEAVLQFASDLPPGPYTLVARAVDGSGMFGPPSTQDLTATTLPTAEGVLVITLTWDLDADLDLHVLDPLQNELDPRSPSTAPPLPFGGDAGSYGYLDYDSNASCVIDGKRQEDAIWTQPPPPGHYVVRVDTASMCGKPIAHWYASATLNGQPVGTPAAGTSVDVDSRGPHDRGAGVVALEFDVP